MAPAVLTPQMQSNWSDANYEANLQATTIHVIWALEECGWEGPVLSF